MRKFMKALSLISLLTLVETLIISTISFASTLDEIKIALTGKSAAGGLNALLIALGNDAYSVIQTGGNILAVLILLIYGVKWMFATPQKKAELKDRLWNYVIGAGLIFGSFQIIGILAGFWTGVL